MGTFGRCLDRHHFEVKTALSTLWAFLGCFLFKHLVSLDLQLSAKSFPLAVEIQTIQINGLPGMIAHPEIGGIDQNIEVRKLGFESLDQNTLHSKL